ncbi:MAG: hypothetical protein DME22_16675 [Verrucomicrobia bacterium]|nr:MAG: hypothetical protein DME22_16675 [Verrucomicrobiota bacterium]
MGKRNKRAGIDLLDSDLVEQLDHVISLTKENQSVVLRMAIRAGLPIVAARHQVPRPEGYFANAYPRSKDRQELKTAMAKVSQKRRR